MAVWNSTELLVPLPAVKAPTAAFVVGDADPATCPRTWARLLVMLNQVFALAAVPPAGRQSAPFHAVVESMTMPLHIVVLSQKGSAVYVWPVAPV